MRRQFLFARRNPGICDTDYRERVTSIFRNQWWHLTQHGSRLPVESPAGGDSPVPQLPPSLEVGHFRCFCPGRMCTDCTFPSRRPLPLMKMISKPKTRCCWTTEVCASCSPDWPGYNAPPPPRTATTPPPHCSLTVHYWIHSSPRTIRAGKCDLKSRFYGSFLDSVKTL